ALWDDHVASYETVFEPLTGAFAAQAIDRLGVAADDRIIDVGAGCGAATLMLAERGARVLSVDASIGMARRTRERLGVSKVPTRGACVAVMDGTRLAVKDASMDAALSVLGVVLFPDAAAGMAEIARVVRPGGRAAVVTWTEPERYELMAELLAAVRSVIPDFPPPPSPPAQLRYRDPQAFRDFAGAARLPDNHVRGGVGVLGGGSAAVACRADGLCAGQGGDGWRARTPARCRARRLRAPPRDRAGKRPDRAAGRCLDRDRPGRSVKLSLASGVSKRS